VHEEVQTAIWLRDDALRRPNIAHAYRRTGLCVLPDRRGVRSKRQESPGEAPYEEGSNGALHRVSADAELRSVRM
jgi:hypothetical protein